MVWHNGWALLLEVGEYVFKLVLFSSFFLKEPPISILTCLKKLRLIFHIQEPSTQVWFKIGNQVLQQVKIKNCEGIKFYNKLKL
jgi:hypothetical protein